MIIIALSALSGVLLGDAGGSHLDTPGFIEDDTDTVLTPSWDDCLWAEEGGVLNGYCSWLVPTFANRYSDVQVSRGNLDCGLLSGSARKGCTILQFNIESIPDTSIINDVTLVLVVDSMYSTSGLPNLGCNDMLMNSTEPSGRGIGPVITNLTDALGGDITTNNSYFTDQAVSSPGTLRVRLNDQAKEDFQDQLGANWFAVGLYLDNLTGSNDTAYVGLSDIRSHHKLEVTYYPQFSVTVRTEFDSGWVTIDDSIRTMSPYVAHWATGDLHYINTDSIQTPGLGVKYIWDHWSDGGDKRHLIEVHPDTLEYIAYFDTLYQLTLFCPSYANVWPTHPDSIWFPPREWSLIKVWPDTTYEGSDSLIRHIFQGWDGSGSGSYTGTNDSAWVQLNEPIVEYALWDTSYWLNLEYTGTDTGVPAQIGEGWVDVNDSVFVMTQESLHVADAWYFFDYWADGAGHLRDSTDASTWYVNPDLPRTIIANYVVNPMLEVFPEPFTFVNPGDVFLIPAILDADVPYPTDSFQFTMHFDDTRLDYVGLIDGDIPWSELTAVPGTGEVTVFGDAPGSVLEIEPPETLFYFQMQALIGSSGEDTIYFDDFQFAFADARTDSGVVQIVEEEVDVTVTTSFGGDTVWVDGTAYPAPYSATLTGAEGYEIGVDSLNPIAPGQIARYVDWDDGGDRFHTVYPISDSTFTAIFDTLLRLRVLSDYGTPAGGGWYDREDTPTFSVSPETVTTDLTRQVFTGWDGTGDVAYSGTDNPATCTMNTPITETAQWQTQHWLELEYSGAGGATPTLTGEGWVDEEAWAPITADSVVDDAGTEYYFAWWSGGTVDDRYNHIANAQVIAPDTVTAVYADVPFTFALDIPESIIAPAGEAYQVPVRFDIPTASELGNINFHYYFDASLSSFSGVVEGDLSWESLSATNLTSGSDGHVLVQASSAAALPVEPGDRLCVLNFIAGSTAGLDSIVANDPGGDISGATPDTGVLIIPGEIEVTVETTPLDGTVMVDGDPWASPRIESWHGYSTHTIGVDSVQYPMAGTQMLFTDWSDGGGRIHDVAPTDDSTFTANFALKYRLTVITDFGTPSGGGYYNPGAEAVFSVAPDSVLIGDSYHLFEGWLGEGDESYTGTANPAMATVNEPITETAQWESHHYVTVNYTGAPVAPILEGEGWYIQGDTAIIEAQDSVEDGGVWYYFVFWQGPGDVFDRYSDSTGASVDAPRTWTATYSENPADFTFGPPSITASEGDGFVMVPVLFNGDPLDMDTIGFSVAFDTSLVRLESAFNGSYTWDNIAIAGDDDMPAIAAISSSEWSCERGDTLVELLFYVDATTGTVPLDFGTPLYDLSEGLATDGIIRMTAEGTITVQTDFGGEVFIDGNPRPSPYLSDWEFGIDHQIGVPEIQNAGIGHRKVFRNWSDGGLRTHYVAPISDSVFTAHHDDSYYLNVQSPYGVATGSGWYISGVDAEFEVSPTTVTMGSDRQVFDSWDGTGSGHYSGTDNPAIATVRGPILETAVWQEEHYLHTDFIGCPGESPTMTGEGWHEHGTWAAISSEGVVGDFVFHHWEGGIFSDANSPSTQVRVDSAATVTAVYSGAGISATDSVWTSIGDTAVVRVTAIAADSTWLDTLHMSLTFGGGILDFAAITECGIGWDILEATASDLGGGVTRVDITAERDPAWPVLGTDLLFCVGMEALANGAAPFNMNIAHVHGTAFSALTGNRAVIVDDGVDITLISATAESLNLDGTAYVEGSIIEVPVNSPHIASAPAIVPDAADSRFRFEDWDDSPSRVRGIRPADDTTLVANYLQQYFVEGTSDFGVVFGDGWFDLDDSAFVGVGPDSFMFGDSLIHRFAEWIGDLSSESNPCTVVVDGGYSIEAAWDTLYRVKVESEYGTAITDGWCVLGDSTLLQITPTEIIEDQSRQVFTDWTGTGDGSYSGSADSIWLDPAGPIEENANWALEHMLIVENGGRGAIFGGGWIPDGDTAWFGIGPRVMDSTSTIRHVFDGWDGEGDSSYTGPDSAAYCRVNEPIRETASWREEYFLAVNDGGHSSVTGAGWYTSGDSAAFSVDPDSEMVTDGVAWIFDGWFGTGFGSYCGDDNPATCMMGEPISETATWALKYKLTMIDSGAMGLPEFEGAGWHTPDSWVPVYAPPIVESGSSRLSFLHWSGAEVEDTLLSSTHAFVDTACTLIAHYANFEVSPPSEMHVESEDTLIMPVILYYPYLKQLTTIQLDIHFPDDLLEYVEFVPSPTLTWSTVVPGIVGDGVLRVWANRGTIFIEPPETLFQVKFVSTGTEAALDTIHFDNLQYDLTGANSIPGQLIIGAPIDVRVESDYSGEGSLVKIDGTFYESPYVGTWIAGDPHEISVPEYYYDGHTRMAWDNWDDGGARMHTVAPLTADTFVAHYEVEHELEIVAEHGTSYGQGWYREGATPIFGLEPDSVRTDDTEFVFDSWTGTGSGSYSGVDNPSTCTMNGPIVEQANYNERYELLVDGVRSESFGSGWFPDGWTANFGVDDEIIDSTEGIRWVFTGWSGAYSGSDNPASWVVDGPNTQTANWELQYLLTIENDRGTAIGGGWYPAGAVAEFSIDSTVDSTAGIRYAFDAWTSPDGGYTGSNNPAELTMTGPITQVAHWNIEYELEVLSERGTVSGGGWYLAGDSAFFAVDPETVVIGGHRQVFAGWDGDGVASYSGLDNPSGIRMDSPVIETALWNVQHQLAVNGGPSGTTGEGWYDHGANAVFSVTDETIDDSGVRAEFSNWRGVGIGSYDGTGNPAACVMMESIIETAIYDTSFELQVISEHGTPLGAGYVPMGGSKPFSVTPDSIMGDGVVYLFARWLGTGEGSYSGEDNPSSVTPEEPVTETAEWDTFFNLTVTATECGSATPVVFGAGWHMAGWVDIRAENPVYDGSDRYHFTHWSGGVFEDEFSAETRMDLTSADTAIAHYGIFEVSPAESVMAAEGDTAWIPIILYNLAGPIMIDSIGFDFYYDTDLLEYATIRTDPDIAWETTVGVPGSPELSVRAFNSTEFSVDPAETLLILGFVVQSTGPSITATHCEGMTYDISGAGSVDGIFKRTNIVNVEIRTAGVGDSVWVDGTAYVSPYNTNWTPGEIHNISARELVAGDDGVRYRFIDWDDYSDRERTVSALTDTFFEANFGTQYRFGVFNSGGDTPMPPVGNHWFDDGDMVVAMVHNPDPVTHWSCVGYYGSGDLEGGGSADSVSFNITQPTSIYWLWLQQVPLYVESPYGWSYPEPGTTWHAVGELIDAEADSFVVLAPDSGMLCDGYSGTGSAPSGDGHTVSFTIDEASSLIWGFVPAYRLVMAADGCGTGYPTTLTGDGYYESGTDADIAASFEVNDSLFFEEWTSVPSGAAFIDASDSSTMVTVDRPMAAVANYSRGSLIELQKSPDEAFGGFSIAGEVFDDTDYASAWVPECWTGNIATTISDTSDSGDSLWAFDSWSDGGAAIHTIGPVCDDIALTAYMEKKYRVRIQKDPLWDNYGSMIVDGAVFTGDASADTTLWWTEGSTHDIEASEIDADAADRRLVWNSWNDGGAIAHTVGPVDGPDSLVAEYGREYRLLVQKNPAQAYGWIDFDGTMHEHVAEAEGWYAAGAAAEIEVSTPDGFADTLWTFDEWGDGTSTPIYNMADVDTSYTLIADYVQEVVVLAFDLLHTDWTIGEIDPGVSVQMIAGEEVQITNIGTHGMILGLEISDSAGWAAGYGNGENRFALKGRFDDSATPPVNWHLVDDAILTERRWASGDIFGPGGEYVEPSTSENLWMRFTAPTSSSAYDAREIAVTIYGHIALP